MEGRPGDGLRLVVVGARRRRQGTGPFLARHAASLGARVVAVASPAEDRARAAAAELEAAGLPRPEAWTGLREARGRADAALIASPLGTHAPWLGEALEAGLHVLCEKPLLAASGRPPQEAARRSAALASAFASAGLLLRENTQWPWTLPALRRLDPAFRGPPARFRMRMAPPPQPAAGLLLECLSHPWSLLQAWLGPDPELRDLHLRFEGPGIVLEGAAAAADRQAAFRFEFQPTQTWPRPAELEADGRCARRSVREPGYRIFFHLEEGPPDGERPEVEAPDPMRARLAAFLEEVQAAPRTGAPADPALVPRQGFLARALELLAAVGVGEDAGV